MGSTLARFSRLCALGVISALGMAGTSAEEAVAETRLRATDGAGAVRPVQEGTYLYLSKGYIAHNDRESFEIIPGGRSQAVFVNGGVATTLELEFKLTMLSSTDPHVWYWVFKESKTKNLWAFQADGPSFYGYAIYVNETGDPFDSRAWKLHDFSRRYTEE
jgi:hypothetical protein